MRLVDADALKEPLELQRASYVRIGAIERAEAYANCLWEIAQAPTVGGWISVEDRLPEDGQDVVATVKDGTKDIVTYRTERGGMWWGCEGWWPTSYVTHWMPLPTPPGGERE